MLAWIDMCGPLALPTVAVRRPLLRFCLFLSVSHDDDCDRDGGGGGGRDDDLNPGTRAFQEKSALSWF